jgi:hypothetical protein
MPLGIQKAFQGAISGRKNHAKCFQDDFLVQESNKSHAYFVKVLEQIYEQLKKITCVNSGRAPKMQEEKQLQFDVNRYGTLTQPDPIEPDHSVADIEDPSVLGRADLASSTSPRYEPDIDPAEEDLLRYMCVLEDCAKISHYVVERWVAYVCGDVLLETATLITDLAVALVVNMELDLRQQRPSINLDPRAIKDYGKWETAINAIDDLVDANLNSRSNPTSSVAPLETRHPQIASAPDAAEQHEFLVNWMTALHSKRMSEGIACYGAQITSPLQLSTVGQLGQPVYLPNLRQFDVCYHYGSLLTASLDILSASLVSVISGAPSLQSLFSADLLMRIHSALGNETSTAFHLPRLLTHSENVNARRPAARMPKYLKAHMPKYLEAHKQWLRLVKYTRRFIRADPSSVSQAEQEASVMASNNTPITTANFFTVGNAAVSGRFALNLKLLQHQRKLAFANSTPDLVLLCHLYNCLSQTGRLLRPWQGLEAVIAAHLNDLFRCEHPDQLPSSFELMSRRAALVMHAPAAAIVQNPRQPQDAHQDLPVTDSARPLKARPLLCILFKKLKDKEGLSPQSTLREFDQMIQRKERQERNSLHSEPYIEARPLDLLKSVERNFETCASDLRIDYVDLSIKAERIWSSVVRYHSKFRDLERVDVYKIFSRVIDEIEFMTDFPSSRTAQRDKDRGCATWLTHCLDSAIDRVLPSSCDEATAADEAVGNL